MLKSVIVCIALLAAQNLCAAEAVGGYKETFGGIALTIAAVVGLIFTGAYIICCFGEGRQKGPSTDKGKSILH